MIKGNRLQQLRLERKLSAQELANELNIGVAQIFRYEAEKSDPSSEVLIKFALFFGVNIDYLVGLTDNPMQTEKSASAEDLLKKIPQRLIPTTFTIDIDRLIGLSPKAAAQLLKSLKADIFPNPLIIEPSELLQKFPPVYVSTFLKELDIPVSIILNASNLLQSLTPTQVTAFLKELKAIGIEIEVQGDDADNPQV